MKFDISSDNVYFTSDTSFVLVSIATTRTGKDILTQETQTDTFASLLASAASLLVSLCVHLRRVSTQGGLASTAETEEERDIAILNTDVGRRVQRELAELDGLEVVHDAEDTLLHLAGVFSTEDDHLHTLEVDLDGGGRGHALREAVGGELTSIVNDEVGFAEVGELLLRRADEHVVLKLQSATIKRQHTRATHTMKRAW